MTSPKSIERRKPVLMIQHAQHEHPAALRRALESQGIGTLWIHPYSGEIYPNAHEVGGVISMGGQMGANDEADFPWIKSEIELLQSAVNLSLPVVGICLGAQMLARALGGRVERLDNAEVGWFPIQLNEEGKNDPIVGAAGSNPTVYHWHNDTFHLPEGATLLASSKACARQAYRIGTNIYGFQFHPEADHQLVLEWLSIDGTDVDLSQVRKTFGRKSVQNIPTQRNYAMKGEKGSLKITAAIGSLFRRRNLEPIKLGLFDELESYATRRTTIVVEFEGAARKPVFLKGRVASLLQIPAAEFVIFEEENTTLWPIRIDDIRSIQA